MTRILASDGMDKAAVAQLEKAGYEVVEQFYEPEELKEKVSVALMSDTIWLGL